MTESDVALIEGYGKELILCEVSLQLLPAIQEPTTSLNTRIEEVKLDIGLLRHEMQLLKGVGERDRNWLCCKNLCVFGLP
ncbi:hypothetical protein GDO81_009982 [Engystomops pustulosus]|uniref:Uncharacterized protein n=1 Tax=Engystomops pustulosus TaxID=76066 RepID=A0AAV7BWV6_ENGPU|nr:hypothetical protein GDO81_009982 [Engystomops pustulosus]